MKILLDTHVFLWAQTKDAQLTQQARKEIENRDNAVLLSVTSIWEIGIKRSLGKINIDLNQMLEAANQSEFSILTINAAHAMKAVNLSMHHRDPFDRMLIAQAMVEGATLLTSDTFLLAYGKAVRLI